MAPLIPLNLKRSVWPHKWHLFGNLMVHRILCNHYEAHFAPLNSLVRLKNPWNPLNCPLTLKRSVWPHKWHLFGNLVVQWVLCNHYESHFAPWTPWCTLKPPETPLMAPLIPLNLKRSVWPHKWHLFGNLVVQWVLCNQYKTHFAPLNSLVHLKTPWNPLMAPLIPLNLKRSVWPYKLHFLET